MAIVKGFCRQKDKQAGRQTDTANTVCCSSLSILGGGGGAFKNGMKLSLRRIFSDITKNLDNDKQKKVNRKENSSFSQVKKCLGNGAIGCKL